RLMGHEQAPPGDGLPLPALAYASDEDCMVAGAKPAVAVADNPENIQDEEMPAEEAAESAKEEEQKQDDSQGGASAKETRCGDHEANVQAEEEGSLRPDAIDEASDDHDGPDGDQAGNSDTGPSSSSSSSSESGSGHAGAGQGGVG
ncbi:unnamed protein product, partial [Effrenium voratum]